MKIFWLFWFSVGVFAAETDPSALYSNSCDGICFFRGNETRSFYGTGDFTSKEEPQILWSYPKQGVLSSRSKVYGDWKTWTGTGWTGQPLIYKRPDGITEAIVGAYDRKIHFINLETGEASRPPYDVTSDYKFNTHPRAAGNPRGDIIKGTPSLDPDGYPIIYFGSRDNHYRALALDHVTSPEQSWDPDRDLLMKLYAEEIIPKKMWDNDWDGNGIIRNDHLYIGGENSYFYIVKLDRSYDQNGKVTLSSNLKGDPSSRYNQDGTPNAKFAPFKSQFRLVMPGWTQEQLNNLGDYVVAIESSPVLFGDRVYFANSGGRVVGLDISFVEESNENKVLENYPPITLDFWAAEDVDATPIVDEDGMIYITVEYEPGTSRGRRKRFEADGVTKTKVQQRREQVGQLIKLDPSRAERGLDPYVWGIHHADYSGNEESGSWATPALLKRSFTGTQYLYGTVHKPFGGSRMGKLFAVNTDTGEEVWHFNVGPHAWSSPLIIYHEDKANLLLGNALGKLKNFDLSDPESPEMLWEIRMPGGVNIESTPAVWDGKIVFGSRDGKIYCLGYPEATQN